MFIKSRLLRISAKFLRIGKQIGKQVLLVFKFLQALASRSSFEIAIRVRVLENHQRSHGNNIRWTNIESRILQWN